MRILRNLLSTCMLAMSLILVATAPDLPRTTLNGSEFYYYDVKKGESIYKVAKTLGVKTSDITDANPQALDGLRAGMRLYIPVELYSGNETPAASSSVKPAGETFATPQDGSVSESLRTAVTTKPKPNTVVRLVEEPEPVVVSAGTIAAASGDTIPAGMEIVSHKVKRGESLYGIARSAGMTMDEVIRLNPQASYGVSPGDELKIWQPRSTAVETTDTPAQTSPESDYRIPPYQPDYSLADGERRISETMTVPISMVDSVLEPIDTLSVAILLPFMLDRDEPTMQAKLFTEFYQGFLLASQHLNNSDTNTRIIIHAFDTSASIDTINSLMRNPEVFGANLIIAPDNEAHIASIAQQMSSETYLFNVFNVKSQLYKTYPNIIQANIPHGDLYSEAVAAFVDRFPSSTPVFLSRVDGQADKDAFVSLLKERLEADTTSYVDITFRNLLSTKDLSQLQDSVSYVFVPVSGQRSEFAKITEAVRRYAAAHPDIENHLFGYPEWITFRGEYFNRLGENNATIYTRFYAAPDEPSRVELGQEFHRVYGSRMLDAAPIQGILGYDSGCYIIQALRDNHGDFRNAPGSYIGIQSTYEFQNLVNHAIYIVNFGPNGFVDKIPLI